MIDEHNFTEEVDPTDPFSDPVTPTKIRRFSLEGLLSLL